MSHAFLFMRFEGGYAAPVPAAEVIPLLRAHGLVPGALIEGRNYVVAPPDESGDTPIGEVSLSVGQNGVMEVAIDRPRYRNAFRALSFDLVTRLGLVMFSSDGGEVFAAKDAAAHLPECFKDQFTCANLNLQNMSDLP
jgi:hypothetical protein